MRVLGEDLGLPPQACAAHNCAIGQVGQAGGDGADESVTHVLPRQVARQDGPRGQVCRHILLQPKNGRVGTGGACGQTANVIAFTSFVSRYEADVYQGVRIRKAILARRVTESMESSRGSLLGAWSFVIGLYLGGLLDAC